MKIIIEIAIGVFAGYCSCYFITDKLIGKTPEQVIEMYLEIKLERLKEKEKHLRRRK